MPNYARLSYDRDDDGRYRLFSEPVQPAVPFGESLQVDFPPQQNEHRMRLHFVHS